MSKSNQIITGVAIKLFNRFGLITFIAKSKNPVRIPNPNRGKYFKSPSKNLVNIYRQQS